MTMQCPRCGSENLHGSHFRLRDLSRLLRLQLPIRCHTCSDRNYIWLWAVAEVRRAARLRHREYQRRREAEAEQGRPVGC